MRKKPPLIQFGYEFSDAAFRRLAPTAKSIQTIAQEWVKSGRAPAGVRVRPLIWGETLTDQEIRERLAGAELNQVPGIVEHFGDPRMTLCDYDTPRLPAGIERRIWKLAQTIGARPEWIECRKTARGWHVSTRWNRKFQPAEICWMQLYLGSDPKREMFNFLRLLAGGGENKRSNLLFSRKL